MALAIVAVACLSSVIVQWSAHFPGQDHVIEHPLFGDLTEDDDVTPGETTPLQQTATRTDGRPHTDPKQTGSQQTHSEPKAVASVELSGIEPVELSDNDSRSRVSHVLFTEPTEIEQSMSSSGRVVQLGTIIFDE